MYVYHRLCTDTLPGSKAWDPTSSGQLGLLSEAHCIKGRCMMFICSNKISAESDDLALGRDLLVWATMVAHQSLYMSPMQLQS
jgi:hypothetical protein